MGEAFAVFPEPEVLLVTDGNACLEHHIPAFQLAFQLLSAQILIIDADAELGKLHVAFHLPGECLVVEIVKIQGFYLINAIGTVLIIRKEILKFFSRIAASDGEI